MTDILAPFEYQLSQPIANAKVKARAKDFIVNENLGYRFSGKGEHLMVKIRKEGENTSYVVNELARACGVSSKNVGWAGLKDRHAVTEQWLSIQLNKGESLDINAFEAEHPSIKIIETDKHNKKLRPGDLQGNDFEIRLTEVSDINDVCQRLEKINQFGVPNYYGAQRFGNKGNNLEEARRWGRDNVRTRHQNKRSLYLSTARSWIFNRIVSCRIEQNVMNQLLLGDIVYATQDNDSMKHKPQLVDKENIDALQQRLMQGELELTAALAGDNALPTSDDAEKLEQQFVDEENDLMALIRGNRMRHDRRAVSLYPQNLTWSHTETDITLKFSLPAGCFATSILRELINEIAVERVYPTSNTQD